MVNFQLVVYAAQYAQQVLASRVTPTEPVCECKDCGKGCHWEPYQRRLAAGYNVRLADGLQRPAKHNTWNQWQWGPKQPSFHSLESFRKYIRTKHIDKALWPLLPEAQGTALEKSALMALNQRMSQLLNCVGPCIVGLNEDIHQLEADRTQRGLAGVQEPPDCEAAEAVRLQRGFQLHAQTVYAALVKESVGLCNMITRPLARFICGMLDKDEVFYGSTNTELCLRDMQKLPDTELAKFCLFFLQKQEGIVSGHAQAMLQMTLNRGYRKMGCMLAE